ncbi:MAG: flavodoxin [Candidatus Saliniplasma sp.]
MKVLVVYYSRTGSTKKVAESISKRLDCDIEEIDDNKNRKGIIGFLISLYEALTHKKPEIKDPKKDPKKYDIVILGTPVWAHRMASLVRTYLDLMEDRIDNAAFFCTYDGSGSKSTFEDLENMLGSSPVSKLPLKTDEFVEDVYRSKVDRFISDVLDRF